MKIFTCKTFTSKKFYTHLPPIKFFETFDLIAKINMSRHTAAITFYKRVWKVFVLLSEPVIERR